MAAVATAVLVVLLLIPRRVGGVVESATFAELPSVADYLLLVVGGLHECMLCMKKGGVAWLVGIIIVVGRISAPNALRTGQRAERVERCEGRVEGRARGRGGGPRISTPTRTVMP